MNIEQIYTGCLAQGAYYIESAGEVAIIDPLREVNQYISMAEARNATVKYIFETHFHADFVSGHLTLAEKTGAPIVYGPNANPDFECTVATDGQIFPLGDVSIKAIHTPGHTMESTTYLLIDADGQEHAIFTGDTLFLGDVGRPDLAQKAEDMTQEDLAATLYDSLRNKIMPLPDHTVVYPGHGAGSACGKNMRKETTGSLGEEKRSNYALRVDMSKEEFVKEVLDGLLPPPAYFPLNVMLNKQGYKSIDEVLRAGNNGFAPAAFRQAAEDAEAIVLDVRPTPEFIQGHVPGSIFIGLNGGFAPWVGALIRDIEQPILLVCSEDRLKEAVTRLARVGFDNVIGYLQGGVDAWQAAGMEIDSVNSVPATEFGDAVQEGKAVIYDVRKPGEFAGSHLEGATHTPLSRINEFLDAYEAGQPNYVHCAGGYRSVIGISILKSRDIHDLINVEGGYGAIKKLGLPQVEPAVAH